MKKRKPFIIILVLILLLICIFFLLRFCSTNPKTSDSDKKINTETDTSNDSMNPENQGQVSNDFANPPKLGKGMTPVVFQNNQWVSVQDPLSNEWYDYQEGKGQWANAKTEDGSFWVWIPRYAYKISGQTVEIIFLKGEDNSQMDGNSIPSDYLVHPAFTKDVTTGGWSQEITGFWVSKVEAARLDGSCVFQPNLDSYNNTTVSDAYTICRNLFNQEDSPHLIKNSEWGAIAYLSMSKYGRNETEISPNITILSSEDGTKNSVTAGGNGIDGYAASPEEALQLNVLQSTTGTVYGVYDMAGGLWERVAAYIYNGSENLELNGKALIQEGEADQSNPFKTVYIYDKELDTSEANYEINKSFKGDAIFETSTGVGQLSWFGDDSSFMYQDAIFLHRGGTTLNEPFVGIFAFSNTPGMAYQSLGFRCVLITDESENE